MQILQRRSILPPLLRRRSAATSPAPLRPLGPTASPSLRSFTASAPPRWCPPALAQRDSPLVARPPEPPVSRVYRFPHRSRSIANTSGNKGDKLSKPDNGEGDMMRRASVHDGKKHARENVILLCGDGPRGELSDDEEFARLEAEQLYCDRYNYPAEDVDPMRIFPYSTHRDGSIYRGNYSWKKDYRIVDRNEKLYGYIATRDILDPLLNYVVNFSRNDPIIVKQGSLIEMTGPKRGIELCDTTLIEYDMRIKTGEQEKDDLQLIDGASIVDDRSTTTKYAFTRRIHGDFGAVDITVSRLDFTVEATIEVYISEVRSSFNLCVGCFTSGLSQEIQLFDGTIGESCGLRRSVVAVVIDTWMDLKFKVGSGPSYSSRDAEHCCTFKAINHGWTSQLIKTKFGSILVKVTWSTLSFSNM